MRTCLASPATVVAPNQTLQTDRGPFCASETFGSARATAAELCVRRRRLRQTESINLGRRKAFDPATRPRSLRSWSEHAGRKVVQEVGESRKEGRRRASGCEAGPARWRQPADCEGRRRRPRAGLPCGHAGLEKRRRTPVRRDHRAQRSAGGQNETAWRKACRHWGRREIHGRLRAEITMAPFPGC